METTRRNLLAGGVLAALFSRKAVAMSVLPAPSLVEHKALLTGVGPINEFCNYSMIDRSFVVPVHQGPVVELGLYSTAAGQWRPKLCHDASYDGYNFFYVHPSFVSHSGSGWEWVKIPRIAPNGAMPVYVGGYFQNFPLATIQMAPGPRSEKYGDISGVFAPVHGNYATPALGARVVGIENPVVFFTDFDTPGYRDGCSTFAQTWSVANGKFTVSNFTSDDENHNDGIGVLTLLIFITRLGVPIGMPGSVVHKKADLRNARVVARVRGINYDPKQSVMYPWIQGRHPTDPNKFANWAMTSAPLNDKLTSGNWETIDVTLDPEATWTYAGNNLSQPDPDRYSFLPLVDTMINGDNFHFPAVRPVGTPQPTGTVEWDYIGITYADVG